MKIYASNAFLKSMIWVFFLSVPVCQASSISERCTFPMNIAIKALSPSEKNSISMDRLVDVKTLQAGSRFVKILTVQRSGGFNPYRFYLGLSQSGAGTGMEFFELPAKYSSLAKLPRVDVLEQKQSGLITWSADTVQELDEQFYTVRAEISVCFLFGDSGVSDTVFVQQTL